MNKNESASTPSSWPGRPAGTAVWAVLLATSVAAQAPTTPPATAPVSAKRDVTTLYADLCASCHGPKLQGGLAPSMLDDEWKHGGDDASLAEAIRRGLPDQGMPAFSGGLSDGEIRAMVVFIRERRAGITPSRQSVALPAPGTVLSSKEHSFRIETVASGLATPWGMAFLPDGRMLVTEKPGRLRVIERGQMQPQPVSGTPTVYAQGQAGLLDVAVHPGFAENGWIYLAYSDPATGPDGATVSLTTIVRGRIRGGAWVDQQSIWKAPAEFYLTGGNHFGCRLAFDGKGYLFFTHGERDRREHAQELARPNGKVHRIHDDGRIPSDNPFVGRAAAFPSIWTYGNRNPQGLAFQPGTGILWETEHGPRGGDEVNVIRGGRNYGWPIITYGMNYDGSPITSQTAAEGMEQPVLYWVPSIAVMGMDFYDGDGFPRWKGNLFVTGAAQQELRRLVVLGEEIKEQEVILKDLGRLRDVATGPDGAVYVAVNDPGTILRLVPVR